jgi:tetratricopeptide (TPR) repeat protein
MRRSAALLFVLVAAAGCDRLDRYAQARRDHWYAVARQGIDDSSLTIPVTTPTAGYPSSTINPFAVRRMVTQHQFDRLDSLFDALEDSARSDYRNESYLFDAYDAMYLDTSIFMPLVEWIKARPHSVAARIAMASRETELGWEWRSAGSSPKTMRLEFDEANRMLDTALAYSPHSAAAYRVRLHIARHTADTTGERLLLVKGLEDIPASYYLRTRYMRGIEPHWGGSLDAMRAFIAASDSLADSNPRLRHLDGYVTLDSAETLEQHGHLNDALAAYTRAVAMSDDEIFHLERGKLLARLRRYTEALAELERAVGEEPTDHDAHQWRGYVRQRVWAEAGERSQEMATGALSDYRQALLLNPTDRYASNSFAWLYNRVKH